MSEATSELRAVSERLSSGLRINRAADDAAGLSISSSLDVTSRVYAAAIRNVNDSVSMVSIAEGAVRQLSDISIRIEELATQASNGVYSKNQRTAMHSEAQALVREYNRIVDATAMNNLKILNGQTNSFTTQAGFGTDQSLAINIGSLLGPQAGTGTFTLGATFATGDVGVSSGLFDLNNDGFDDLITVTPDTQGLVIRWNDGSGGFSQSQTFSSLTPFSLSGMRYYFQDLNNDGRMDVVASTYGGTTYALTQNSSGTFSYVTSFYGVDFVAGNQTVFGDFDGDGNIDLAQNSIGDNNVHVRYGAGDGTFNRTASLSLPTGAGYEGRWIQAGDLNGDGITDILGSSAYGARVFYGNSNGTFAVGQTLGAVNEAHLVDLNGDGRSDIISRSEGGLMQIHLANSDGTFALTRTYSVAGGLGFRFGDFDGDGDSDLVALDFFETGTATYWRNDGGGNLTQTGTISAKLGESSIVKDINGDGVLDIVGRSVSSPNQYLTLLGNGDGTFRYSELSTALPGSPSTGTIQLGDLNGDGVYDLLIGTAAGYTSSLMGVADPTRTSTKILAEDYNLSSLVSARYTLGKAKKLRSRINLELGVLGAQLSRLQTVSSNLSTQRDSMREAASRITDADIAQESAALVSSRIRQQAAAAVLSQANQQPSLALKLLKGI